MSVHLELADHIAAMVAHLQSGPSITDIVPATMIRGERPALPGPPRYYIGVVNGAGGSRDEFLPIWWPRWDLWCYGPDHYEAMRLYRRLALYLEGPTRRGTNFVAGNCRVHDVHQVSGPNGDLSDEGWPAVRSVWRGTVDELEVAS